MHGALAAFIWSGVAACDGRRVRVPRQGSALVLSSAQMRGGWSCCMPFSRLGLSDPIVRAVTELGYTTPTRSRPRPSLLC